MKKVSARAENHSPVSETRLGFSVRSNGLKNPCNRPSLFQPELKKDPEHAHRLCFRIRSKFSQSWKFSFYARAEVEHVFATIFQPGGWSEISARAETHPTSSHISSGREGRRKGRRQTGNEVETQRVIRP